MTKRIAFLSLLLCLLTACGNKGPLVLPDKPAPAGTPAETPPETPAAPATEPPAGSDAGAPATQP